MQQTLTEDYIREEQDDDVVQHWCKHAKELKKTQLSKAIKFVKHNCIAYIGKDDEFDSKYCFVCMPLNIEDKVMVSGIELKKKPFKHNYNFTTYKMYKNENDIWECNCQAWQTKHRKEEDKPDGCNCSHILALLLYFKLKNTLRTLV